MYTTRTRHGITGPVLLLVGLALSAALLLLGACSAPSVEFADLEPGTWDVSVQALKSDGQSVVAVGSASVDLQAGTTTSPPIPVEPQQQGSGSIDLTVTWPNAAGIDGVASAKLTPIGGSPLDITDSSGLDAAGTAWS